jgi:DNA (cytosine-5)-methyltransferase 1
VTDNAPTAIDLCSGAGGFSLGAIWAGFDVRAAFEIAPSPRYTYKVHLGDRDQIPVFAHDVTSVAPEKVPDDVQAIFAGPNCQPFSEAQGGHFNGNPEETTLFASARWIRELRPALAVIENVGGLKRNHPELLGRLLDSLRDASYEVGVMELNAADYCVPQRRERVFICAVRGDHSPPERWTPPKAHTDDLGQTTFETTLPNCEERHTVRHALGDLPDPLPPQKPCDDGVHLVSEYDQHRVTPHACGEFVSADEYWGDPEGVGREFRSPDGAVKIPPNHIETDHARTTREGMSDWPLGYTGSSVTDRRLDPDTPAPTMTVSGGKSPAHYAGRAPSKPDAAVEDVRRLTVRECAILQTFPIWWCFAGTKQERFRQVCNAVPVRLAEHVAGHLREAVFEQTGAPRERQLRVEKSAAKMADD